MKPIVVLATGDEREEVPRFRKCSAVWYKVEGRQIAVFYMKQDGETLKTIGTPVLEKELKRWSKRIERLGVNMILPSTKLLGALGNRLILPNISLYSGETVFWRELPSKAEWFVKKGKFLSVSVAEAELRYAPEIARRVARHCRRLVLITQSDITSLSEELYLSFGLVPEKGYFEKENQCDLVFVISGNPLIADGAAVLRMQEEKVKELLSIRTDVVRLPVVTDRLATAEAFEEGM